MCSLAEYDRRLRERLGQPNSPPFLGHYAIAEDAARRLHVRVSSQQVVVGLREIFLKWPTLTTAWIARHIRERYGEEDDQRFWPILAELFGHDIPVRKRNNITTWFQQRCRRLELPVPQDGQNVDRFVVQAGALLHQLDVLVRRFLETERTQGLPDEDDDVTCLRFASEVAERLRPANPRLARI